MIYRWLTGQEWLSWLFRNLKLLDGLLDWKVTRPVAEALAADHPDRVAPALRQVDERLAAGWKPRSLAASVVDAVQSQQVGLWRR